MTPVSTARPWIMLRLALVLGVLGSALPAQSPVKICLVGDSILRSFGGQGLSSPRYHLDQLLDGNGYAFDFVGHFTGVYPPGSQPANTDFDQDVEAVPGARADYILSLLPFWMATMPPGNVPPDIVIFHLGTNDIGTQPASEIVDELGQCIDAVRAVNPVVTILMSQLIPSIAPSLRRVEQVNSLIPGMVAMKDTVESRVIVVDQYSGFVTATDLGPDGLHPTNAGEIKMAQVYYDALLDFLSPVGSEYTTVPSTGCTGAGGSVPAPVITGIRGQAASLGNSFSIEVTDVPAGAAPYMILGFDPASYFGVPLPFDIGVLGATGCLLYVGPDVTFPLPPAVGSDTLLTIPVPDQPIMVGGEFYLQAAAVHPSLNPLGLILSDKGIVTIVAG